MIATKMLDEVSRTDPHHCAKFKTNLLAISEKVLPNRQTDTQTANLIYPITMGGINKVQYHGGCVTNRD